MSLLGASSPASGVGSKMDWSYDQALNALKIPSNTERLKSLDDFISKSENCLKDPVLFGGYSSQSASQPSADSKLLTDAIKTDIGEIAQLLKLSEAEVTKVVVQVLKRFPTKVEKQKRKNDNVDEVDTRSLFIAAVLKDKRKYFELTRHILTQGEIEVLGDKYCKEILENSDYISKVIVTLGNILPLYREVDGSTYQSIINSEVSFIIIEAQKLLQSLLIKVSTTASNVLKWFKLWESSQFFTAYKQFTTNASFKEIKALISVTTLLFLGLDTTDDLFDETTPLFSDFEALKSINNSLVNSPTNAIILYAWSIVLYSLPEDSVTGVFESEEELDQLSRLYASKAASLDVFKVIDDVHNVLSYDNFHTAVLSSFLISAVPFIQLTDRTSQTYLSVLQKAPHTFIEKFFSNPSTERLLYVTKAKFPEVLTPYLRILSINAAYAHSELSHLSTYMNIVSTSNLSYENDSKSDAIVLRDGLYINPPYEKNKDVLLHLPPATRGRLIPTADQNTEAAIFNYEYNGWSLLGRILQNIAFYSDDQEVMLVILHLLTNTIEASDIDTTSTIFEKLSSFLDDNDILDIILKYFEQSLHQRRKKILVQIIKFFGALVNTYPQIVWSHLVRSDLLEHAGRGGLISTILGSVETVNGDYEFTVSALKLYNELVLHSLTNTDEFHSHKAEVVPKFTDFAIQVFESFIYWNFESPHQKFEIATLILDAFSKILYAIYGVDPDTDPSSKVTNVLANSAKKIIAAFTVALPDVRVTKPIFASLDSLSNYSNSYESSGRLGFWFTQWTKASLEFSRLVISIRSVLNRDPSTLERTLYAKTSSLVRIYFQHISLRSEVLQLLTQLVGAKWESEVPSLLAHLGAHYTNVLVSSLSNDVQLVYDDFKVKKYIYSFFSAIIQGNQKGLSMIFLSGQELNKERQTSLFSLVKKDIQNLSYYPDNLSIHLVDAIAYALNTWSSKKDEEEEFVETLAKKLSDVLEEPNLDDNKKLIQSCYGYKLNSRIAEICALIIFTSKTGKASKPITDALENGDILTLIKPLYQEFTYRASLHGNLNRNFEEKWPGLKLRQFVRSPLALTTTFGEGAIYDLRLLDDVLGGDQYWVGNDFTKGYRSEVITASINLQLVSAQISAAKSWGALLTAYVKKYGPQKSYWGIVKKLLDANIAEGTSTSLFREVYRVRTELAFFFSYLLSKGKPIEDSQNRELLQLSLQLICSQDVDFLSALSANDSDIYRPLLRIISNCLSAARNNPRLAEELSDQLLEFFELVIAKGSTVLFDAVQSDINQPAISGRIEDLFLIISLFKALVQTRVPPSIIAKFSLLLVDFGTLRSLLNIYSRSHTLRVNNEPIFAEASLAYMTELVAVDGIADQLILNGLFSVLIESPISVRIQEGGIFVHTFPRLHNIWSNGLLAVILILLSKFGSRLLPEIGAFANYFSKQTSSTIQSWSQDSVAITTPALQETEQIIILQNALKTLYFEYGQNSHAVIPESIETIPGLDTPQEKKALSKAFNHLLAHPKFLTSRIVPTTLEEQRMFEGEEKTRTLLVEQIVAQMQELDELIQE